MELQKAPPGSVEKWLLLQSEESRAPGRSPGVWTGARRFMEAHSAADGAERGAACLEMEKPPGAIISDPDVPEVEFGYKIWRKQLLVVPRCLFNQKLLTCALWTSLMAVSFFHFSYSFIWVTNIDRALLCIRNRGESSTDRHIHLCACSHPTAFQKIE